MASFGIIAEGPCDQTVIENILLGYFQPDADEPTIHFVQPLPANDTTPDPPGGWTRVFTSLANGDVAKALQWNDYLIIHIDTDVQEEKGFDVPRRVNGQERTIEEQIEDVRQRLIQVMGAETYQAYADRLLFAIAVEAIECWLLPLLYSDNKAQKTTGCLDAANHALRKGNNKGLASDDTKFPKAYEKASKDYRKRKNIDQHRDKNPSLSLFLRFIDERLLRSQQATPPDANTTASGEELSNTDPT